MKHTRAYLDKYFLKPVWDYMIEQQSAKRSPWSRAEKFWFLMAVLTIMAVAVFPGGVAELASVEVGPRWISSVWRSLNVMLCLYVIFYIQRIPASHKWILGSFAIGLEGNLARNMFELQPLTASYMVLSFGITLSAFRLMSRPTIYERCETLSEENKSLKATVAERDDEIALLRSTLTTLQSNNRGRRLTDNPPL